LEPVVFLFDLDGVMVQPLGYRAAVRATVNDFSQHLGLGNMAPEDHTIAIYEAQGITCEWDMIPITLAILLEAALAHIGKPLRLDSWQDTCRQLQAIQVKGLQVDYAPTLRELGQYMKPGEAPAESLLALCRAGDGSHLFPCLSGQGVLNDLLLHTRRPAHSKTTHIFQTYVLGDQVFAKSMGLTPEVATESLLERYDLPLLASETRGQLLAAAAAGVRMAVYTARPSIPLGAVAERLAVFTPEAELALELIGMQAIPVIGSGQMGEAAMRLGEHEDRMAKPSPYHALAAIAAAWLGDRAAALRWVEYVFRWIEREESLPAGLSKILPDRLSLDIFEDSPAGMRGGKAAARILAGLGTAVEIRLWGVSDHPEKRAALSAEGAQLFPDINQAVAKALEQVF
jgi:hypothetical protein